MMLVTLLLLFLNSNTHAADGYVIKSYFNENTVHTKFPTDFYTFKFENKEENDIEIKSKISYNGKDYDSKIKFRINIYFGNKFPQSDAQIKFEKYLQDKYVIPIFNQIKNGFDKNIADTFEHNIWPIIYLCDEGEYNFFYNVKNNNYIYDRGYYFNIIEKDIF